MRCPICHEEVASVEQAERWGPEWAHSRCVTAYNYGKADATPETPAQPAKIPIPPAGADALDVVYAEGWNAACDAFFGGKPAAEPLVITVQATSTEAPAQASAVDERAAFEAWYSQNAFNFERDPIGSRECGLQWEAWQSRAALAQKGDAR